MIEGHLALEGERPPEQAVQPIGHPAAEQPQRGHPGHGDEEGRQLARLRNLPLFTGLLYSSR